MQLEIDNREADILLKLLSLGRQQVKRQLFVMMYRGQRIDVPHFVAMADRVIASVNAQIALQR